MLLPLLLSFLFISLASAQGYCQCQSGGFVNDPLQQCMSSANYSVQNACFVCPVQNGTAKYYYCDSLFRLGFAVCGQQGALAAMTAACLAFGGDTASSDFRCFDNGGLNKSQVNACSGITQSPTSAPTSDGSTVGTPFAWLMIIGLFIFISL
jgi:hypothetical protein